MVTYTNEGIIYRLVYNDTERDIRFISIAHGLMNEVHSLSSSFTVISNQALLTTRKLELQFQFMHV